MSAIVAFFDQGLSIAQPDPGAFVLSGLQTMSERAPGEIRVLRCDGQTVLGQRASRVLAKGWSPNGSAQRGTGENTVSLAVSGYIDNVDELCDWIGTSRRSCRSSVATLLLEAYMAKGKSFVERVGGAFAIVIRDSRTGELHLMRDRLGIEPLYYWHSIRHRRMAAASEPKAILQDPQFPRVFDETALLDLMNSTSRIPGTTVYKHLREIRPGEMLAFRDGRIRLVRYWTLPQRTGTLERGKEAAEHVATLLDDAVQCRIHRVESSQAFLLSGGLDSSIICAVAQRICGNGAQLATFSFAYPEEEIGFQPDALHHAPDSPYVDIMQNFLGTRHEKILIDQRDFRTALEETVRARDLPGVGDLDITLLWLFRRIKEKGREEIFSGEGADDLFGGFPWLDAEARSPGDTFPWLRGTGAANFLHPAIRDVYDLDEQLKSRWRMAEGEMPYLNGENSSQRHMDKVFYMQITRFLPFLLDRVDRMSAAAGMRVQLPFLDHRLVECAWDLPYGVKMQGRMEKGILRQAYESRLPAEIAWRKKSGFAVVRNRCYTSAVVNYLKEEAMADTGMLSQIVDLNYLRAFLERSEWSDGTFNAPPILPRIVMLDMWVKLYNMTFESGLV